MYEIFSVLLKCVDILCILGISVLLSKGISLLIVKHVQAKIKSFVIADDTKEIDSKTNIIVLPQTEYQTVITLLIWILLLLVSKGGV